MAAKKKQTTAQKNIVNTFFIVVFLGIVALFAKIVLPFLTSLIIAALLSVIFYPLFKKVTKLIGGNEAFGAAFMCLFITLVVVIPFGFFATMLSSEAFNFYIDTKDNIETGYYQELIEENSGIIDVANGYLAPLNITLDIESQRDNLLAGAQNVGLFIYQRAGGLAGNLVQALFNFVTIIFVLYYLFKDHKKISSTLLRLSPLPDKIEVHLIKRVADVGKAVFFGNMVTALVQGILGGIGFFAAGFGNALFWATLVAVSSLIPSFGVFIITIPASLILFIQGKWIVGSIFLAYNVLIVGSVDNILKPKLIESKINLHPLLVFIGVLGGILVFGPMGVVYGPLVVTLFVAFVHIYEDHFRDGSFFDEEPKVPKKKAKPLKSSA